MEFPPSGAFDARLPLSRAVTLPRLWYVDPALAQREAEQIFLRSWQALGPAARVERPGQYLTALIAGEPIVVVRGDDGILRGFFNVCRHRAAEILREPCGQAKKLRCQYHGWTYDLQGRLRGLPEFQGVQDFDPAQQGLVPLAGLREAAGWVWVLVHPLPDAAVSLPADGPPPDYTSWFHAVEPLQGLVHHARRTYTVRCNWKVYVDNYLDGGYHVNTVHPGLADVLNYTEYRTNLGHRCSVQTAPLQSAAGAVGATRTGTHAAYWWLWPNFMLNHYEGVVDANWVLPRGADSCEVIFDYFFRPDADPAWIQTSLETAEAVQEEDRLICESVQRGLGSRSYQHGRFSVTREAGAYQFHQYVYEALTLFPSEPDFNTPMDVKDPT